jgi:hypothetical protein
VVRQARNPDTALPADVANAKAEIPDAAAPWPIGLRVLFMAGAALACWALVLLAGYWLLG